MTTKEKIYIAAIIILVIIEIFLLINPQKIHVVFSKPASAINPCIYPDPQDPWQNK